MTTNFTPAEQQAIEICEADGVCLSPSVMLNSLELLGFKPESATVAQLGAGARALRKLQRMSHGAIAALYEKASKLSEVEPELREQRVKVLLARLVVEPHALTAHERDRLAVPESMLGQGEHFILEVQGDSMIEEGIFDGDFLVVLSQKAVRDGDGSWRSPVRRDQGQPSDPQPD